MILDKKKIKKSVLGTSTRKTTRNSLFEHLHYRIWFRRLCLFYKIKNNLTVPYLKIIYLKIFKKRIAPLIVYIMYLLNGFNPPFSRSAHINGINYISGHVNQIFELILEQCVANYYIMEIIRSRNNFLTFAAIKFFYWSHVTALPKLFNERSYEFSRILTLTEVTSIRIVLMRIISAIMNFY